MALTQVIGKGLGTIDDNIVFGTASKGIYLGVTTATASNLLDDYEEGTFTPACPTFSVEGLAKVTLPVKVNTKLT